MALSDNPFALLNPGPLPARIPNSFGPPPGTIMPNDYDRVKAVLDAQAAAYASWGQANPNPFTAQQIFEQFPGPSPAQQAQTQEARIAKVLADQQAGAALHGQTLNQPFTASQIMSQFPATINPYPQGMMPSKETPAASVSPVDQSTTGQIKALFPATSSPFSRSSPYSQQSNGFASSSVAPGTPRTPGFRVPTRRARTTGNGLGGK